MKTKTIKQQNDEAWQRAFGDRVPKAYNSEWNVHKRVVMYLRQNHSALRFYSTLDGFNLGQQRSLLSSIQWINQETGEMGGLPDLWIFGKPLLCIELKRDGEVVGKSKHTIKQQGWLEYLRSIGIKAEFAIGFEEAVKLIEKTYGKRK